MDVLRDAEDRLYLMAVAFEDELVKAMIDGKGLTYGDVTLSRGERILKFLDDEQRGVVSAMDQLDPAESGKRKNQFLKDTREAGLEF